MAFKSANFPAPSFYGSCTNWFTFPGFIHLTKILFVFSNIKPPISCQAASVISSHVFVLQGAEVRTWDVDSTAGPAHCKERTVLNVTVAERYRGATCVGELKISLS